jgi:hypothetical protein
MTNGCSAAKVRRLSERTPMLKTANKPPKPAPETDKALKEILEKIGV